MAKEVKRAVFGSNDFDLLPTWEEKNIELRNINFRYAPATDLNPEEGIVVVVEGMPTVTNEALGLKKGRYEVEELWCRNLLPDDWKETLFDFTETVKDGVTHYRIKPKFPVTDIKYHISWVIGTNTDTGEEETRVSKPQVIGLWAGGHEVKDYRSIGDMDMKRSYYGPEDTSFVRATE